MVDIVASGTGKVAGPLSGPVDRGSSSARNTGLAGVTTMETRHPPVMAVEERAAP